MDTLATEVLFGGASEGGKSYGIRLCLVTWCQLIPGLQVELYRKFYNDVITNHMKGEGNFHDLLRPLIDAGEVTITENLVKWKHGSEIKLRQLRTDEDSEKSQGVAKHVLVVDEATQIPSRYIDDVRGWVRMSESMKDKLPEQLGELYPFYTPEQIREMFPRIIYSANPIGTSVGYFRRNFVLPAPPETIWQATDEEGGFKRQYIPSKVTDNPEADQEAQRKRLTPKGERVARALIEGDWTNPGGDFFPEWMEELHVIEPFPIPSHWFTFRGLDLGYREPFHVGWYAVADGEEFEGYVGESRWLPKAALVKYREWHGCDPEKPAEGLRLRNRDIAYGILQRTPEATSGVTITDSLPFQDRGMSESDGKKKRTIADEFRDNGVPLIKANTARIHGWSLLRDRLVGLEVAENQYIPMFYVFSDCSYTREYIPALTCHETNLEDAQEKGEATHSCDVDRMACATTPPIREKPKDTQATLRKEAEKNILTFAGARKAIQERSNNGRNRRRRG